MSVGCCASDVTYHVFHYSVLLSRWKDGSKKATVRIYTRTFIRKSSEYPYRLNAKDLVLEVVRVRFDGNTFISPKDVQKGLATYYTVIVCDRTGIFKHLLTLECFIVVQLRSLLLRIKKLKMHPLNTLNRTFLIQRAIMS